MGVIRDVWDLVSKVISTVLGGISSHKHSFLTCNPRYEVPCSSK